MNITPQSYVASMNEAARTRQWDDLTELQRSIYQNFAEKLDWNGLESFFEVALQSSVPEMVRQAVERAAEHLPRISADLAIALEKAVLLASQNQKIRALYCEFFYDGGDASTIDVFTCTRFDRKDDFWASDYDDVIEGSLVQHYFRYDSEGEVPSPTDLIADDFLRARLFASLGRLACDRIKGLPFGFAEHDNPIVYVETSTL